MNADLDRAVRLQLYRDFLRTGRAPSTEQLAASAALEISELKQALERLAAGKAIVLQPESREILFAPPLSAVPTPYLVRSGERCFFAPCVWDGLGVIAMLKSGGVLETSCGCCGEAMTIEIRDSRLSPARGILHFLVPAKQWWDNIVFT